MLLACTVLRASALTTFSMRGRVPVMRVAPDPERDNTLDLADAAARVAAISLASLFDGVTAALSVESTQQPLSEAPSTMAPRSTQATKLSDGGAPAARRREAMAKEELTSAMKIVADRAGAAKRATLKVTTLKVMPTTSVSLGALRVARREVTVFLHMSMLHTCIFTQSHSRTCSQQAALEEAKLILDDAQMEERACSVESRVLEIDSLTRAAAADRSMKDGGASITPLLVSVATATMLAALSVDRSLAPPDAASLSFAWQSLPSLPSTLPSLLPSLPSSLSLLPLATGLPPLPATPTVPTILLPPLPELPALAISDAEEGTRRALDLFSVLALGLVQAVSFVVALLGFVLVDFYQLVMAALGGQ